MPITTQEIAVGRKYADRKIRQPNTCVSSRNAIPSGITNASGIASSRSALFCSTRRNAGSWNSWVYAEGPTQVAVMPSHCVIE